MGDKIQASIVVRYDLLLDQEYVNDVVELVDDLASQGRAVPHLQWRVGEQILSSGLASHVRESYVESYEIDDDQLRDRGVERMTT